MIVREYKSQDLPEIIRIWNEVVEDGIAFPQEEMLDLAGMVRTFVVPVLPGRKAVFG